MPSLAYQRLLKMARANSRRKLALKAAGKKAPRFKKAARKEVKKLVGLASVSTMARDLAEEQLARSDVLFTAEAMEVLRDAAEGFFHDTFFPLACRLTRGRRSSTMEVRDIQLAQVVLNIGRESVGFTALPYRSSMEPMKERSNPAILKHVEEPIDFGP